MGCAATFGALLQASECGETGLGLAGMIGLSGQQNVEMKLHFVDYGACILVSKGYRHGKNMLENYERISKDILTLM